MIKRMIQKQYDQLLETCKQTKAEIEYLNQNLADSDFVQRLEIEKTQELIDSIEHDVKVKKQEIHNSAIKNRYQQLTNLYQQTTEEIQLLQSTLENDRQIMDQNQTTSRNIFDHQSKRERLDLSATTEAIRSVEPTHSIEPQSNNDHYESMLKKWHESLNKINELEEQQLVEESVPIPEAKPEISMISVPVPPGEKTVPTPEVITKDEALINPQPPTLEVPEVEVRAEASPPDEKTVPTPQVVAKDEAFIIPSPSLEIPVAPAVLPQFESVPQIESVKDEKLELKDQEQKEDQEEDQVKKPSKGRSVLGAILNFIFYLILVGTILFLPLIGMYNPTGAPRILLGYSIVRVDTDSMSPTLPINTLILTRRVDPADLQVDDIVTFIRFNETTITHRIYEIYENHQNAGIRGFRLIGNRSDEPDNEIHQGGNLIGRMVLSNYPFGQFMMYAYHNFLFIMMFVISILLTLFLLKRKIVPKSPHSHKESMPRKKKREKEKNLQEE